MTFRVSGSADATDVTGQSLEGASNGVALGVGEQVEIGMTVDTLNNTVSGSLLDSVVLFADANPSASAQGNASPDPQYVVDGEGNDPNTFGTISEAVTRAGNSDEEVDGESISAIYVEPGTYDESITIDVDGLSLRGPGAGIDTTPESEEATIEGRVNIDADQVVVDGLSVSPPTTTISDSTNAEAIRISADNVIVQNNIVEDFARNGPADGGFFGVTGISAFGGSSSDAVENPTIRNNLVRELQNTVSGGAAGIAVQGNVEDATIEQNTIEKVGEAVTPYGFGITIRDTSNHDVTPTNVEATDNKIADVVSDPEADTVGVGIGVEASGASEVALTGNNISNATFLLEDKTDSFSLSDLSNFAENNTLDRGALLADGDFGDSDTRSVIFDSIDTAGSIAGSGDTVEVIAGTYDESVSISTDSFTLKGPNAGTAYDGSRDDEAIISAPSGNRALDVSGANVEIDGVRAEGNGDGVIFVNGDGNDLEGTITVTNSIVRADDDTGADLTGGVVASSAAEPGGPKDVIITNNDIESGEGAAVNVFNGSTHGTVNVSNNEIRGDPGGLRDIEDLTVENNDIFPLGSPDKALDVSGITNSATISSNTFTGDSGERAYNDDDDADVGETDESTVINNNTFVPGGNSNSSEGEVQFD